MGIGRKSTFFPSVIERAEPVFCISRTASLGQRCPPPRLDELRYAMVIVELEDGSGAIHVIVGSLLIKIKGFFLVFENSFPYATEILKTALSAVF